ncbi:MAG: hypothetical protein OXH78_11015, partial [Acidimicrobiaceae bacterium]|nr:hypothetical protein [Acidimicrobiaceae bacterium]
IGAVVLTRRQLRSELLEDLEAVSMDLPPAAPATSGSEAPATSGSEAIAHGLGAPAASGSEAIAHGLGAPVAPGESRAR